MGAVVAGPYHGVRGRGRPGRGTRGVNAFVAVDGGVADGSQGGVVFHDAAKEIAALVGQVQFLGLVGKGVGFAVHRPDRDMGVAAGTGEALEGFRHEAGVVSEDVVYFFTAQSV